MRLSGLLTIILGLDFLISLYLEIVRRGTGDTPLGFRTVVRTSKSGRASHDDASGGRSRRTRVSDVSLFSTVPLLSTW